MNDAPGQSPRGYEDYYLTRHAPDLANYEKAARGYRRKLAVVLAEAPVSSCLDLGCGSGMLAYYLRRDVAEDVVGVDACGPLLEVARQRVEAEFVRADATEYLAACGRRFSVVFLMNLLEHIPREQVAAFLSGVRKVIEPGGCAIVRAPNWNCLGGAGHFADDLTHCTPLTDASLRQAARQAGFTGVEFLNQFRMQSLSGKARAAANWCLHRAVFRLRGGRMPKVFHRNLYAKLIP